MPRTRPPAHEALGPTALEQVLQIMPDGLAVVDDRGVVRWCNDRLAELAQRPVDEMVDRPVEQLVPGAHADAHSQHRHAYVAGGAPPREMGAALDIHLLRADGTELPVDIALAPIAFEGERLVVAAVRDATARRRATAAVRAAERRWAETVEHVELAAASIGIDGSVTFANPFLLRTLGLPVNKVVGQSWIDTFVDPDDRARVASIHDDVLRRGVGSSQYEVVAGDGRTHLFTWYHTVLRSIDGGVEGCVCLGNDVTVEVRDAARTSALMEVAQRILSGRDGSATLDLIGRRAREIAAADMSAVAMVTGDGWLQLEATDGDRADDLAGLRLEVDSSVAGEVMRAGHSVSMIDAGTHHRTDPLVAAAGAIGPTLFAPLAARRRKLGTLMVARRVGSPTFTADEIDVVQSFATQAALAVDYSLTQREVQRLAVFEDRERIARDLHDTVIQRLFATGLELQTAARAIDDPEVAARVGHTVDSLDDTIREIRYRIFELEERGGVDLAAAANDIADHLEVSLGFRPEIVVEPDPLTVPHAIGAHAVAVLREALSNVARHAQAQRVDVSITSSSGGLHITVADDGRGFDAENPLNGSRRGHGLANMANRADELGGTLQISTRHGTTITWEAPLP